MANTYIAIATTTVGSGGASEIEFANIPGTYTDLIIKASLRATSNTFTAYVRLNSNSSGVYSYKRLGGYGTSVFNSSSANDVGTAAIVNSSTYTASTFSNVEIYIPNYTSSNNKSTSMDGVNENNATAAEMALEAGLAPITSAITNIKIVQNLAQYSTATLYGIKNN